MRLLEPLQGIKIGIGPAMWHLAALIGILFVDTNLELKYPPAKEGATTHKAAHEGGEKTTAHGEGRLL